MVGEHAAMKQIAGFTEKQACIVEALAILESDAQTPASLDELIVCIRDGGGKLNWIGIDHGGMRQSLILLLARGIVERTEHPRVRNRDVRWRWKLTRAGWDALMRYYDERWG